MLLSSLLLLPLLTLAGSALAAGNPLYPNTTDDGCVALKSVGHTNLAGETFYKPSQAAACLNSIPFDPDLRDNIIEVVSKTWDLEIYEFNHINWPAPLAQHTDVRAELKRMSGQTYESDYDFNKDLYETLTCYSSAFQTVQTLALVSLAKDSSASDTKSTDSAIFIVPDAAQLTKDQGLDRIYKDLYGIDAAELAGKEVVKIDGMDPWTYIDQIANTETGSYQDLGTRRSAALASYASSGSKFGTTWNRDLGTIGQQRFPVRETITYDVMISQGQTKKITVPYLSLAQFEVSTAQAFFKDKCLVSNETDTKSKRDSSPRRSSLNSIRPRNLSSRAQVEAEPQCETTSPQPRLTVANSPVDSSAYVGGRWNQFFVLSGNEQGKVGVIYITTFSPDEACIEAFAAEVAEGVQNFTRLGVERVIIDTTDDGGGFGILSAFWQRVFSGPEYDDKLGFDGVFRVADLWTKIHSAGSAPSSFVDTKGQAFKSGLDLFKNKGSDLTINGHDMPVTDVVRDQEDMTVGVALKTLPGDWSKPVWPADSLLIFSNGGTCGSACSLLTNFLNLNFNVQTHLAVARPDQPTEYSSFAAQVFTTDDLYALFGRIGLSFSSDPSLPPPLKVKAKLGIAIRGFYTPGTTDWLQYTSIPADKTFALTAEMYMDPLKMYAKAAQTKWGGAPPKENKQVDEKAGMLGMSQSTTVKAAVGVGAAGVVGATGFIFFLIRRRSNRAKRGAYTEVAESMAPLGTFEVQKERTGRLACSS